MNVPGQNLDPEDKRLQRELRGYEPVAPSDSLKERIRSAAADAGVETQPDRPLQEVLVRVPAFLRENWFGAAAAALAMIFGGLLVFQPNEEASSPQMVSAPVATSEAPATPSNTVQGDAVDGLVVWGNDNVPQLNRQSFISTDQHLVSQKNLGIVETEDGTPMWKIEYELLNRASWKDPQTGSQHQELVPEKRVLFISVHHD